MPGSLLLAQDVLNLLQTAGILLDHRMSSPQQVFAGYATDGRLANENQLFIAYAGVNYDAHQAIPDLVNKSASIGFIVDSVEHFKLLASQRFVCLVRDAREAWAWLAAERYGHPQNLLRMIGITGTNGKTSTVWFIRQLLRQLGEPCLMLGTLGVYCDEEQFSATHTTPDPDELFRQLAFGVSKGMRWAIMEVSSHAVAQHRLGPIRFDAAAFTSFSRDHLDFHRDMADYFAAKWRFLTDFLKPLAPVWLFQGLAAWLPEAAFSPSFCFYGAAKLERMARPQDAIFSIDAMTLASTELKIEGLGESWRGTLPFAGDFAAANFTAAWLLVSSLLPGRAQNSGWATIRPVPGRFEPVAAAKLHGLAVIIDYAHTPDALEKTLIALRPLTEAQLWVVFGCGGDRDKGKRPLMGLIAEKHADHLVLTSDNPRSEDPAAILSDIAADLQGTGQHRTIVDREQAIQWALLQAKAGDTILIAGKGHENYQLIGKLRLDFDDHLIAAKILQARPLPPA